MEDWREIQGFPNYMVSNFGRVKSLKKSGEIILKPSNRGDGYLGVILCVNGKRNAMYIHRLVADSFIENKDKKLVVDHIDNDKTNNVANNLQFITQRENLLKNHPKKNNAFKGVTYQKGSGFYYSVIQIGSKKVLLGSSKSDKKYLNDLYIKAKDLIHLYNGNNKAFRELVHSNLI